MTVRGQARGAHFERGCTILRRHLVHVLLELPVFGEMGDGGVWGVLVRFEVALAVDLFFLLRCFIWTRLRQPGPKLVLQSFSPPRFHKVCLVGGCKRVCVSSIKPNCCCGGKYRHEVFGGWLVGRHFVGVLLGGGKLHLAGLLVHMHLMPSPMARGDVTQLAETKELKTRHGAYRSTRLDARVLAQLEWAGVRCGGLGLLLHHPLHALRTPHTPGQ